MQSYNSWWVGSPRSCPPFPTSRRSHEAEGSREVLGSHLTSPPTMDSLTSTPGKPALISPTEHTDPQAARSRRGGCPDAGRLGKNRRLLRVPIASNIVSF